MTASQHENMTASQHDSTRPAAQDPSRAARAARRLQALEQQVRLLSEAYDQNEARLDGISAKLDSILAAIGDAAPAPGAQDGAVEPSDVELATFGDSLPPEFRAIYDAVAACRHDVAGARGVTELARREAAEAASRLERIESGVAETHDGMASLTDEVSSLASDVRASSEQRLEGRARMPQRNGQRDAMGRPMGGRPGMGGGASRGWGPPQVMDDGLGQAAYDELSQRVSESCDEIRSIMRSSVRDIASVAMNVRDAIAAAEPKALPAPGAGHVDATPEPAWAPPMTRRTVLACALSAIAAAASLVSLVLQVVG